MNTQEYHKLPNEKQDIIFKQFMKEMNEARVEVKSPFQFSSWLQSKNESALWRMITPKNPHS